MSSKKESDMDKAARLLAMVSWGMSLDAEDDLWLRSWKALMQEADGIEYGPSIMFRPTKASAKEGGGEGKVEEEEDEADPPGTQS